MSVYTSVDDFNKYISTLVNKYDIDDYIRLLHSHFHNEIDITLLNNFIKQTIDSNIFCIDSNILQQYNLISNNKDIFINKFIKEYQLVEDIDYKITTKTNIIQLPNQHNKEYKLSAYAFKYCLLLSGQSKYIKYFLLIETMISYYKQYEELYNQNNQILSQFDIINGKLMELNCKQELYGVNINLNELTNKLDHLNINIDKILTNKIYNDIDIILNNSIQSNNNEIILNSEIKDIKNNINAVVDLYSDIIEKLNDNYIKHDQDEIDIDEKIANLQEENKDLSEVINKELKIITDHLINIEINTNAKKKSSWWRRHFRRER